VSTAQRIIKTETMRAARLDKPGAALEVRDVPLPLPRHGWKPGSCVYLDLDE
jgi:hypothetical protein